MPKPVILQLKPFPDWDQQPLEAAFDLRRYDLAKDPRAFLATHGPQVQGIATRGGFGASRDILEACPQLEIVAVYGVGYDAVDLDTCRARGIRVTNTPDVLTGDVADLGVGMLLALSRGIVGAEAHVRSGAWEQGLYPLGRRVFGMRAGILGLGRIGRALANRLKGFDMSIAYSDLGPQTDPPGPFYTDAVALAQQVDVLFVTLSASDKTRGIVNDQVLAALGPTGVLINISRASNVDEPALLNALEKGAIRGAALDVFAGEPAINPRFLSLPNVLLQPHHASATVETRQAMGQLMRDNLTAHFAGSPLPSAVL